MTAILVGVAWFCAPVAAPMLDPKTILGEKTSALAVTAEPLRGKEDADLIAAVSTTDPHFVGVLRKYLALKEHERRDNAMIHYLVATDLASGPSRAWDKYARHEDPSDGSERNLIDDVLENGWRTPQSDELLPYLEAWQPALAEIRAGAALDYARGLGMTTARLGPEGCPEYAYFSRRPATMLCVEGRYLESQGRFREALDNYLAALTMGRDLTAPGTGFGSHRVGGGIALLALRQTCRLAESGALEEPDLRRAAARLRRIEETLGTTADALDVEMLLQIDMLRILFQRPGEWEKAIDDIVGWQLGSNRPKWRFPDVVCALPFRNLRSEYVREIRLRAEARRTERIPSDMAALYTIAKRQLSWPWSERKEREGSDLGLNPWCTMQTLHPLFRFGVYFPAFELPRIEELRARSLLRQARLVAALASWKREHGEYPKNLRGLAAECRAEGLPMDFFMDPFMDPSMGSVFCYRRGGDGKSYTLWGFGPGAAGNVHVTYEEDKPGSEDAEMLIFRTDSWWRPGQPARRIEGPDAAYDPTNGSVSAGDVFLR